MFKPVGRIITVDAGEIYLLCEDPEIHLEPLTNLAKTKRPKRKVSYGGKSIPVY